MAYILFLTSLLYLFSCGGGGSTGSTPAAQITGQISSITTSTLSSCAIRGGYIKCWGSNSYGQLGDGTTNSSTTPVFVSGISTATKVETNGYRTCASTSDRKIYCWGFTSTSSNQLTPVLMSGLNNVTDFSVGRNNQACAINSGLVYCWGKSDTFMPLGSTPANSYTNTPTLISGLTNVDRIEVGFDINCVRSNNRLMCWGYNSFGIFGNNTTTGNSATPVDLSAFWTVSKISSDLHSMCVLDNTNRIFCAGDNGGGQIYSQPNVSLVTPLRNPTQPYQLTGSVTNIAAGDRHTCAQDSTNSIKCWGSNSNYALGINSTLNLVYQPTGVYNITANIVALAAGGNNTCATFSDETAYCWGDNTYSQIGNGNYNDQSIPARVQGL